MKLSTLRTGLGALSALLLAFTAFPVHADEPPAPPGIVTTPKFAEDGKTIRVGRSVERVAGDYGNAQTIEVFRLRDGQPIPDSGSAFYTPVPEDFGHQLVYAERARDPQTGAEVTAYSDPVTVLSVQGDLTPPTPDAPVTTSPDKATADEVQTMIDDMEKMNDVDLRRNEDDQGGRYTGPGHVVMGNEARGTNAPGYWQDQLVHRDLISDKYWQAVNPWMYITPGRANAATNTRVELSQIKLNVLHRSTNRWETIELRKIEGMLYPWSLRGKDVKEANLRDGQNGSIQMLQDPDMLFHGWGGEMTYDTKDILAVHAQVQARLVVDDQAKADDRDKAQLLLQVGVDYYPVIGMRVDDPLLEMKDGGGYFPGAGLSRAKLISNDWQTFNFINVDVAKQEPGGSITVAQLRDNPPPSWPVPSQPATPAQPTPAPTTATTPAPAAATEPRSITSKPGLPKTGS